MTHRSFGQKLGGWYIELIINFILYLHLTFILQDKVIPYLELARLHINESCKGLEAWQIGAYAVGLTLIVVWIWEFLFQPDDSEY